MTEEEDLIRKVAMAIYAASNVFSMMTVYDAVRYAEVALKTVRDEDAKARIVAAIEAKE